MCRHRVDLFADLSRFYLFGQAQGEYFRRRALPFDWCAPPGSRVDETKLSASKDPANLDFYD